MSAHPFGRQPGQSPRHEVPGWARLAAICAIATMISIAALVAGIDIGQLGGGR